MLAHGGLLNCCGFFSRLLWGLYLCEVLLHRKVPVAVLWHNSVKLNTDPLTEPWPGYRRQHTEGSPAASAPLPADLKAQVKTSLVTFIQPLSFNSTGEALTLLCGSIGWITAFTWMD